MRGPNWKVLLVGCILSTGTGALLASSGVGDPASPSGARLREPSTTAFTPPTLQGNGETAYPEPPPAQDAEATRPEQAWMQQELQSAGSRLALLQQMSQLASRAAPGLTGPVRSTEAYDFWSAQAVMDLLAHESIRDVVREHQVARGVLEEFVLGLLASGVSVDPIDPGLAADLLPLYVRAQRHPGQSVAIEDLASGLRVRIPDPGLRDSVRLQLTSSVRPPRASRATNAVELATELVEESTRLDLEERIDAAERGLERLERLQDETRSLTARFLERMGSERALQMSIPGLSDIVRGLLVCGVDHERIMRADLRSSFQPYKELERERQRARLAYDRLWLGRHLEQIAAIRGPDVERPGETRLVRELARTLQLTNEQVETLSQYYAAGPNRSE